MEDLLQALKQTYIFYRRKYVMMAPDYIKTVKHRITDRVITSHLEGKYALSVFAGEKATRFISIDVDAGGPDAVRKVMAALEEMGIPHEEIHVSTSGRKGYHVDVFFKPFIYNKQAKNLYDLMIWKTGLDPRKIEFRPTHTQAIKIPLGYHAKTGNRCWFLDRDTLEPIEDESYIFQIDGMSAEDVKEILEKQNKARWYALYEDMQKQEKPAPKEHSTGRKHFNGKQLTEPGTRHHAMVDIATSMRKNGASQERIEADLEAFYRDQDPMMIGSNDREVLRDIREIAAWACAKVKPDKLFYKDPKASAKWITFTPRDVDKILGMATKSIRKVAFLIVFYCKLFDTVHMSYDMMSQIAGCTYATANKAVARMVEADMIKRESGGCCYVDGKLVKRTNTYQLSLDDEEEPFEFDSDEFTGIKYTVKEKINEENFDRVYYGVLAGLCTDEYLRARLTKGEMEAIADARGCAYDSAGRDDAGLQDVCAG